MAATGQEQGAAGGPGARAASVACLAACVAWRPLVPDGGGGLWPEAALAVLAAMAVATHAGAVAQGWRPAWARPGLLALAATLAAVLATAACLATDPYAATFAAGARGAALLALVAALQAGDEASGGALVRAIVAAAIVATLCAACPLALSADPSWLDGPALHGAPLASPEAWGGVPGQRAMGIERRGALAVIALPVALALCALALAEPAGRGGRRIRLVVAGGAVAWLAGCAWQVGSPAALAGAAAGIVALLAAAREELPVREGRPVAALVLLPLMAGPVVAGVLAHSGTPGAAWPTLAGGPAARLAAVTRLPALVAERPLVGQGIGGYAAADAARCGPGDRPAAGVACAPLTQAVEHGIPVACLWLGAWLLTLAAVRVRVAAPPEDPMAPPPLPPLRITTAALATTAGGAAAIAFAAGFGGLDLRLGGAALMVWVGICAGLHPGERPGTRALPPLLRAGIAAAGWAGLTHAALADALAWPSVATGGLVLLGVGAAPSWRAPGPADPAAGSVGLARAGAALAIAGALGLAAFLPLAWRTDGAVRAATAVAPERRIGGAEAVEALPGAARSPRLLALRAEALSAAHATWRGGRPDQARLDSLATLSRRAESAWDALATRAPRHATGRAAAARWRLGVALARAHAFGSADPRAISLAEAALVDAQAAADAAPADAGLTLLRARARLVTGDRAGATADLAAARALAAQAPPDLAPAEADLAALAEALR